MVRFVFFRQLVNEVTFHVGIFRLPTSNGARVPSGRDP